MSEGLVLIECSFVVRNVYNQERKISSTKNKNFDF